MIDSETEQTTEQNKQTSRTTTRKGIKKVTAEERIQKANGGGWNWKQWRQQGNGIGRSEVRNMQLTAVDVGGIDWVSHWLRTAALARKHVVPARQRTCLAMERFKL